MKNLNKIEFTCPKCGGKFSLDVLLNHNSVEFNELIDKKAEEKLNFLLLKKVEEVEEKNKLKFENILKKQEFDFLIKQQNIENNYKEKIQLLINDLTEQQNITKNLEKSKELELAKNYEQIKNQFSDKLTQLILEVENQKAAIQAKDIKLMQELDILSKEKEIHFFQEKEKLEIFFRHQIEELKIKNAENRILQSKTKGENWELEVENELYKAFGYFDKIEKITLGNQKADYLQIVRNDVGKEIGKIVYEVKNAKWSDSWLPKLAVDVANNKTKYGILVTSSFHEKFHADISFTKSTDYENIWIADPWTFVFIAQVVRKIIEIENTFLEKEKVLTNTNNSFFWNSYNNKVVKLKDYLNYTLPEFIKIFKKQLADIDGVKNSLLKSSNKLEKSTDILNKKFDKLIKQQLEKITEESESENEFSTENSFLN